MVPNLMGARDLSSQVHRFSIYPHILHIIIKGRRSFSIGFTIGIGEGDLIIIENIETG